jgi:hypothetical protein
MTPVTRPAPPSTTAGPSSARQTRTRLISEAVVASYIHEISARTGPGAISAIARRRGGQVHHLASRPARARAALRRHDAPRLLVRARLEA